VTQPGPEPSTESRTAASRISVDWWATIFAGAITLLAVAGLLPKIPW
jgi:hypothetical protein